MYGRFVAFQSRHAILASTITGGAVMSLGDTAVQLAGSGTWDYQRNGVVSAYNGGMSPFFYYWWKHLDGIWPGTGVAAVVRKTFMNQLMVAPFNSALFLTWSTAMESLIKGDCVGADGSASAQMIWEKVAGKAKAEVPSLVMSSCCFWLPANAANFMFMPLHLRVVFMSSCSVVWGAYITYVVHR
ncbi:Mpv17-like protein 2 [Symbiodinium microadriaticum]|uniref:Mpv17-like protein 2 n=1 Tax=Symbiodinium microadriaticum TaxID=2951 RepID=A0A1Q9C8L5_SYMMI|nr:Mpv17-like protein 2 [Symbiodinium microadriaticum]CAE7242854.1 MPV17L2 [Symbiodinium microadriaticum]